MRRATSPAVLALCIFAAGCGGGSGNATSTSRAAATPVNASSTPAGHRRLTKSQYEAQVRGAFGKVSEAVAASKHRGDSSEQQLVAAQAVLVTLVDRLQAIRPPAEVAQAHKDFTHGVSVFASRLTKATAALKRGDQAKAEAAVASLSADQMPPAVVRRTLAARATFRRLGYRLGPVSLP